MRKFESGELSLHLNLESYVQKIEKKVMKSFICKMHQKKSSSTNDYYQAKNFKNKG